MDIQNNACIIGHILFLGSEWVSHVLFSSLMLLNITHQRVVDQQFVFVAYSASHLIEFEGVNLPKAATHFLNQQSE